MTNGSLSTLQRLLEQSVEQSATEVLLLPGEPPAFRVKGKLERTETKPLIAREVEGIAAPRWGPNESVKSGTTWAACMPPSACRTRCTRPLAWPEPAAQSVYGHGRCTRLSLR